MEFNSDAMRQLVLVDTEFEFHDMEICIFHMNNVDITFSLIFFTLKYKNMFFF